MFEVSIAAGRNSVTDAVSGNLPQFNSFSDIAEYGMKLTLDAVDAVDVGGSGKLAKTGIRGLADLGSDWAMNAMMSSPDVFLQGLAMDQGVEFLETGVHEVLTIRPQLPAGQLYGGEASVLATGIVHRHHSYPKYLGGDPNQPLTEMPADQHKQLHKDMNDYMVQQTDANSNHMRPQRGNSKFKIEKNFTTAQREEALKGFYKVKAIMDGSSLSLSSQNGQLFKQIWAHAFIWQNGRGKHTLVTTAGVKVSPTVRIFASGLGIRSSHLYCIHTAKYT